MEIFYIPYEEIDRVKWDKCIHNAKHGSLYGTSLYLDAIARKWAALITADYKTVMPLIFRKKAGISYLYQPAFLPQVSIFSAESVSKETADAFLAKVFEMYSFAEMGLAYPLIVSDRSKNIQVKAKNNYVINLSDNYKIIAENYHVHFKKSLRRLQKHSFRYEDSPDVNEIMTLYNDLYFKKISGLNMKAVTDFFNFCKKLKPEQDIFIRRVCAEDSSLFSAVLLLRFRNRLYNMISCITSAGRKAESNYFLYDKIMEEFSGKKMMLDLEGSDIKGIADFYLKMNPVNEQYSFIKYNNLPALLKFVKK